MSDSASYFLRKLKNQYLFKKCIEISLWSFAASLLIIGVVQVFTAKSPGIYAGLIFIVILIVLFFVFKLHKIADHSLLSYLNKKYPELQESADLLIKDAASLSTLELIQLSNTLTRLEGLSSKLKTPHNIGKAALGFAGAIAFVLLMSALDFTSDPKTQSTILRKRNSNQRNTGNSYPSEVESFKISIIPPSYTGQKPYFSEKFDLKVPEGTNIRWNLKFNQNLKRVLISFAGKDSLVFQESNGTSKTEKKLTTSSIYQITWTDSLGTKRSSDYYQIEVVEDKAPEISFSDLRQSIELTLSDKPTIELKAKISDDYSITNAYIIATVAKGSGESVKFREEKLQFTKPQKIRGQNVIAERVIDIKRLGLEPGDELYFYGVVYDNKQPIANRSRTETFFITLLDTASQESVFDAGLGVDLMPEYFRSQRQIIMDTEKLLRNKKSISKKEFNFLSNELGYDQKVLRLKYGEFLGEEFESELAPGDEAAETQVETVVEEAKEGDDDMAEKFGHAHDKDNDHNLVEDKKPGHAHEDAHDPDAKENPLEAFVHAHDDAEEATFFLQSVRTKLKAALTEMWDAELYLRLYEPEKSLPFQYKALKLLKEVSNDSRIYVHKTGFDPPPIKEEKRLTGDLTEIKNSKRDGDLSKEILYPGIRSAVATLDNILQNETLVISKIEKERLQKAGQELTALALENPVRFLPALTIIKNIEQNQIKQGELASALTRLQKILYAALPTDRMHASSSPGSSTQLEQSFIDNLQKLKND